MGKREPLPAVRIATTVGKLGDALAFADGIEVPRLISGCVRYRKGKIPTLSG